MLNMIAVGGRLTKAPELRRTNEGTAVCSFTIACDRDYQKDGVDFFDIVAWRSTAEFAEKYLDKGRLVTIVGRLQIREWTDKNGSKRRSAEIVADHIYFGDSKKDNPAPVTRGVDVEADFPMLDDSDEQLPF